MKTITITTKFGPLILQDNDDRPNDQLAQELSELLRASNITILKTSKSSAVIRPSLVSGIVIHDDTEVPTQESTPLVKTTDINEPEESEQNVEDTPEEEYDIIKDMD